MRRLIYLPIVHTGVEMGSMYRPMKDEYIRRFGIQKWEEHNQIIEDFWQGIRRKVLDLNLNYQNTRLYQDGLPVCGKEIEIVRELVRMGSRNHEILLELIRLGSKLEGTEDPKLLLEEYENLKRASVDLDKSREKGKGHQRLANCILKERDTYIAQRIDETLHEGEMGLLFIGIAHKVNEKLPRDIGIDYLIYRLPFKEGILIHEKG